MTYDYGKISQEVFNSHMPGEHKRKKKYDRFIVDFEDIIRDITKLDDLTWDPSGITISKMYHGNYGVPKYPLTFIKNIIDINEEYHLI